MEEPSNESALLLEALNLTEGGRTVSELIEMMRKLVCLESEVRAAMSHVVAVATSQGVPESTGHSSAAELLKSEFHLSGREASELAVSAIRLRDQLPCTYVALRSGLITWSHATTLVRAVDRLGFGTVQGAEHDWIELIATRTSPEALQRVVNARRLEHDGYSPRTAPRPQPGADPLTPTDTSTTVSEATTFNNASEATDTPVQTSRHSMTARTAPFLSRRANSATAARLRSRRMEKLPGRKQLQSRSGQSRQQQHFRVTLAQVHIRTPRCQTPDACTQTARPGRLSGRSRSQCTGSTAANQRFSAVSSSAMNTPLPSRTARSTRSGSGIAARSGRSNRARRRPPPEQLRGCCEQSRLRSMSVRMASCVSWS
ncbi:DUF222 domain-containing protein [Kutzneria chonburiensis]|uniref:DUF222 domain-containing protein n=1 Tax=Kutzneria chonburiensis TaxID=1483604 RepID=UPI003B63F54B